MLAIKKQKMSKKTNIIKFHVTAEEIEKWDKEKKTKISSDSEDSSADEIVDHPKKMLESVIDKETAMIANNGSISKTLRCNECDIMVIRDHDNNYWYHAKQIATILEYGNTADAIIRHVDNEYKKSFADMMIGIPDHQNVHPKTVFIDDSGFIQLISRSKKPEAVELWKKITKEILPTLFRTGNYEMPITESDINRINKSFYDDNMLSEFMGNPCVYFAYVGKHKITKNGITKLMDVFKYGNSIEISRRDLDYLHFSNVNNPSWRYCKVII